MARNSTPVEGKDIASAILLWFTPVISVVIPFLLFVNELADAQRQWRINHGYVPVQATVLASRIERHTGSKGAVHYTPQVEYEFHVGDGTYRSKRLAALYESGSEAWARSIVERFKVEQRCRAYYDPGDPSQAVLLRRYSFSPYLSMLGLTFLLAIGTCVSLHVWLRRRRDPAPAEGGWFELPPDLGERERLLTGKACVFAWYLLGGVAAAHYVLVVPPPHVRALTVFAVFAGLGLIPVGFAVRYFLLCRTISEARLLLDQSAAILGQPFHFKITQNAPGQLSLRRVRFCLLCVGLKVRGKSRQRRILHEQVAVQIDKEVLHQGEPLELRGELTPPPDQPPSGPDASGKLTRVDWQLALEVKLDRAPDYRATFPIVVRGPAPSECNELVETGVRCSADIQLIAPGSARTILSKSNILLANLMGQIPTAVTLLGVGLIVAGGQVVFPDKTGPAPFLPLSWTQAVLLLVLGGSTILAAIAYAFLFMFRLSSLYMYGVAKRTISRRRDAIVQPGPDSVFVDIVPRRNWNRFMAENADDIGFLKVDAARREVLFEGDRERYRIPADSIRSCELQKIFISKAAQQNAGPNASGFWLVVIRAAREGVAWEAPIAVRDVKGYSSTHARHRTAAALQAKIQLLLKGAQTLSE